MRQIFAILLLALILTNVALPVAAQETVYPTTEAEIVKRLKITRGLSGVADDAKTPRVAAQVLFDSGSDRMRPDSFPLLNEFGKAISGKLFRQQFVIIGHTDDRGSVEFNIDLSMRRAQAVKTYLVNHYGIEPSRLSVQGHGLSHPIASNASEEGRALNRRVEFTPQ